MSRYVRRVLQGLSESEVSRQSSTGSLEKMIIHFCHILVLLTAGKAYLGEDGLWQSLHLEDRLADVGVLED